MSEKPQRTITIWFFVGALFTVYGALIAGCGVYYGWVNPPESPTIVGSELHVDFWWGSFLFAFGLFFTICFWPFKKAPAGEPDETAPGG